MSIGVDCPSVTKHSKTYKWMIFFFIISLGLGEVVSLAGIKLSYITSIILLVAYLLEYKGKIVVSNRKYTSFLIFCFFWIIYASIQVIWVQNYLMWWFFYRSLLINIFIIVIIITYIWTEKDLIFVNKSFIVLLGISLAVGLWEIQTGGHIIELTGSQNLIYYRNRPIAFYGNGNDYATVLIYGLFAISLNFYFCRREKTWQLINGLILIGIIYELKAIDARAALYSAILLCLVWPLCIWLSRINKKSKKNYQILLFVILIIISILIIYFVTNFSANEIVYEISSWSSAARNYRSDLGRVEIITNGLKSLLDTAGFGVGAGQSILVNNMNLHNFYLELLIEYGIFIGGYMVLNLFHFLTKVNNRLPVLLDSLIKSFPIVMILLGISSSGALIIRPTWVIISLLYGLKYSTFFIEQKTLKCNTK